MRLIAFQHEGRAALGARLGTEVVLLADVVPGLPQDPALALAALGLPEGAPALAARLADAPRRPLAGLTLLPVIPRPGKVVC
ncbi:5-oxopent-3-ene-1,2,5-tricarboxylate decarboxylase, partial [Pseudoroseomonas aestuarii]